MSTPFIWRPYTNDESAFFSSGGVSINYRFDGTKATVTTHTNEDSVTIGDHERGNPVLVSPTKKTYTLDKFAYIDEFIPVHMIEQIQAPIVQSRANAAADAVAAQLNTEIRTQLLASTDATLLLTAIAVTSANWGQHRAPGRRYRCIRGCTGRSHVERVTGVARLYYQR